MKSYQPLEQTGGEERPSVSAPVQLLGFLPTKSHALGSFDFVFQNDDNFLNIIYEAYLFSMTQAAMKKTM